MCPSQFIKPIVLSHSTFLRQFSLVLWPGVPIGLQHLLFQVEMQWFSKPIARGRWGSSVLLKCLKRGRCRGHILIPKAPQPRYLHRSDIPSPPTQSPTRTHTYIYTHISHNVFICRTSRPLHVAIYFSLTVFHTVIYRVLCYMPEAPQRQDRHVAAQTDSFS